MFLTDSKELSGGQNIVNSFSFPLCHQKEKLLPQCKCVNIIVSLECIKTNTQTHDQRN